MTYVAVVNSHGQLQLGDAARQVGFKSGAVVEVIVSSSGSLILVLDHTVPIDVPYKRLKPGEPGILKLRGGAR